MIYEDEPPQNDAVSARRVGANAVANLAVVAGIDVQGDEDESVGKRALRLLHETCTYVEIGGSPVYVTERKGWHRRMIAGVPFEWHGCEKSIAGHDTMRKRHAADLVEVTLEGKKKKVDAFTLWSRSSRRKAKRRVGYHYNEQVPEDVLNLVCGFTVDPKRGRWDLMLDHIQHNLCAGDVILMTWLLDWLADLVQNPDKKRSSCVVLRGAPGTGKTKLAEWIAALCGHHALKLDKPSQLIGRFNDHLDGKLFVAAEESAFGTREAAAVLKDLITSGSLTVEPKNRSIYETQTSMRLMIITNEAHAVVVDGDDRRYFVLDVSARKARDGAYFAALDRQMFEGGLAAMFYDLKNREISSDVSSPPKTKALAQQKLASLDPLHAAMLRVLAAGALRDRDNLVLTLPATDDVVKIERARFDAALGAMVNGPQPTAQDHKCMRNAFGIATRRPRAGDDRSRVYEIPSAARMIRALAAKLQISTDVIQDTIDETGDAA